MTVHYLEIVATDANAVCATYERLYKLSFDPPNQALGGARVANLPEGGLLGVRAPMAESEAPVVRPYLLVEDIERAVREAVEGGAKIAHPPMELPGLGKFAIFVQAGIQHGVWQK